MKRILLLLSIIAAALSVNATNYYVSATGNDAAAGTSPATAWKSLAKVNSFTFAANDSILLKRGDVFFGSLIANRNNLNFSAYGTGNRPLITGLVTLSTWVLASPGIYKAALPAKSNLNMVLINGRPQQIGRYPNVTDANGGYLTYESSSSTSSITDNEMTSVVNWTGAEIVVRKNPSILERAIITSHSGTTFNFRMAPNANVGNTPVFNTARADFGYFIQDDIRTLDQMGEWYLDTIGKTLNVYFGTNAPGSYNVQASIVDTLMNLGGRTYISIAEIDFEGGNLSAVFSYYGGYITVKNCDFRNMGSRAVHIFNSNDVLIENVQANNCLSNSIQATCRSKNNVTVRNCRVKNCGQIAGMGSFYDASDYVGIFTLVANSLLVENNVVDTVGMAGIYFNGNDVILQKNVVNYFCSKLHDQGGIYTYASGTTASPGPTYTNRIIRNNIVMNGIGAPAGTNSQLAYCSGIYLDGRTMNVIVQSNTVFNSSKNGVHCNNPSNITIRDNTFYNNLNDISFMRWAWGGISNLNIKNNVSFPLDNTQRNIYYTNGGLNTPVATTYQANLASLGVIDSNYYNSLSDASIRTEFYDTEGGALMPTSPFSLVSWKSFTGHDASSRKPAPKIQEYTVNSTVTANLFSNSQFNTNISGVTLYGAGTTASWDNTSKLTGTGSIRIDFASPTPNRYSFIHSSIGAVSNAKKYLLRFKTLGTTVNGIVRAYIRMTASPYTALIATQSRAFGTTKMAHEFLFNAPTTAAGGNFVIEVEQNSGTTYIDDIEFYEVTATVNTVQSQVRLEYNATNVDKTISLGSKYAGVDSTIYNGTITLKPFTSKVLIKIGVIDTLPLADAGSDKYVYLPADTVRLNGLGTGSTITGFTWAKVSGPASGTINSPASASTKVSNLVVGTYRFELRVVDSRGNSSRDTLSVIVSNILPVKLLSFAGNKNNNKVDLKWVAEETNTNHYEVERSANGREFTKIAEVAAANNGRQQMYTAADELPLSGINYYRLKMVDNDNSRTYSRVIQVNMGNLKAFTLGNATASPSGIKLSVTASKNQPLNVMAVDAAGRVIMKKQVQLQQGFNSISCDVPLISKNICHISLFNEENRIVKAILSE